LNAQTIIYVVMLTTLSEAGRIEGALSRMTRDRALPDFLKKTDGGWRVDTDSPMLENSPGGPAYWEPQGTAQDPRDRSCHVSSMMSPMTSWKNILVDWAQNTLIRAPGGSVPL
jgi:hypothetical protein